MNFDDTPEEAAFRARVRHWLDANASRRVEQAAPYRREDLDIALVEARVWQAKKAAAGFAGLMIPADAGGAGGNAMQAVIYRQEEAHFDVPHGFLDIGLELCIPVVLQFARKEHSERFIRPALRGEEIWCQLFSEPSSGSDVAGARLRAMREANGDWTLNGQKVWVSGAHYADFGIVIARSDPDQPKHRGLTFFWVDLRAPGVSIRPIRQASGLSEFNEVFFDDVCIPDTQRLGKINGGWDVVVHTLMLERLAVGAGYTEMLGWKDALTAMRVHASPIDHERIADALVDVYLKEQGLQLSYFQALTALSRGEMPGPEFSVGKLVGASMLQQLAYLVMDIMGQDALTIRDDDALQAKVNHAWFWGAAARIAGGTDEIVKNVLAERVLALPPEVRIDKEQPFSALPS